LQCRRLLQITRSHVHYSAIDGASHACRALQAMVVGCAGVCSRWGPSDGTVRFPFSPWPWHDFRFEKAFSRPNRDKLGRNHFSSPLCGGGASRATSRITKIPVMTRDRPRRREDIGCCAVPLPSFGELLLRLTAVRFWPTHRTFSRSPGERAFPWLALRTGRLAALNGSPARSPMEYVLLGVGIVAPSGPALHHQGRQDAWRKGIRAGSRAVAD